MSLKTLAEFGGSEQLYREYLRNDVFRGYREYLDVYRTCDGGAADGGVKSFGEWLGLSRDFGRFGYIGDVSCGDDIRGYTSFLLSDDHGSAALRHSVDVDTGVCSDKFESDNVGVSGNEASRVEAGSGQDACEWRRRDDAFDGEVIARGKNYKRNQRKKKNEKKFKKGVEGFEESGKDIESRPKDALRLSLEKKWALENELKAAKAARELELLKAEDLSAVKKLRERKVQGATERTMVQIEKAHASLVRSGDVPGVRAGFCQTVVDGEIVESVPGLSGGSGECSISPSSSISEREVREMKKELEDVKAENEKLKKRNYRISEALKVRGGDDIAVSVRHGDVAESAREAFDDVCGVDNWEATGDLDMDPDTLYVGLKNEVYCGGYDYSY